LNEIIRLLNPSSQKDKGSEQTAGERSAPALYDEA
jgi:hypothetical protein